MHREELQVPCYNEEDLAWSQSKVRIVCVHHLTCVVPIFGKLGSYMTLPAIEVGAHLGAQMNDKIDIGPQVMLFPNVRSK